MPRGASCRENGFVGSDYSMSSHLDQGGGLHPDGPLATTNDFELIFGSKS